MKISSDKLKLNITEQGGAILSAHYDGIPLLREYNYTRKFNILKTASFPLIPLGNRIAGNVFTYDEQRYYLHKNTSWDEHYLHGDAWQLQWRTIFKAKNKIILEVRHAKRAGEPYSYWARQKLCIDNNRLFIQLYVENTGLKKLPFGLGHHFFFPLTEQTLLLAKHGDYWTEGRHFLPEKLCPPPEELNFTTPRPIPKRWINNGYEAWDSLAVIEWPERKLGVQIAANNIFKRFFLFRSMTARESQAS